MNELDERRESRLEKVVKVRIRIEECSDIKKTGNTILYETFNLSSNGIGIRCETYLPEKTKVGITISTLDYPIALLDLLGETKWIQENEDGGIAGILLEQSDPIDTWRNRLKKSRELLSAPTSFH